MLVFCDTSALYAVGNRTDEYHAAAARTWRQIIEEQPRRLITTNYVAVEIFTLAQRRHGLVMARSIAELLEDTIEVAFVDEALHAIAVEDCVRTRQRHVSLVDCVSFAFMHRHGIEHVFGFDRHFTERGFKTLR